MQQGNQTTPVKLTCEQCLTKFLNAEQILRLTRGLPSNFCERILPTFTTEQFQSLLLALGVSGTVAAQLIQCLIDAGVQFGTGPGSVVG